MKINNVEFDFDATDVIQLKKAENALQTVKVREQELMAGKDQRGLSDTLKDLIDLLAEFFLEATGKNVLEGVTSYKHATDCYYQFLDEIQNASKKVNSRIMKYNTNRLR